MPIALIGVWLLAPYLAVWSMALAAKKGEESSQRARDRIVLFGERAIAPTIASIEEHSPWERRYCYLPSALQKIGGSAHEDLLAAIVRQDNPTKRTYLISALQSAFQDYSRFGTVIADFEAKRVSHFGLAFFAEDLRHAFPDAPPLVTDNGTLNPDFKAYWTKRSEQSAGGGPRGAEVVSRNGTP